MIEYLKEGFTLANRNLQLVFVRISASIINLIGLIVCLGLPAVLALTYLGFDIIHAKNLLPYFMERPYEFLSRYMALIIFLGVSVILYLLFVSIVIIYTLGGVLGVMRNFAVSAQHRFKLSSFFREANKNFPRLCWLLSIESLVFSVLFLVLFVAGAAAAGSLRGFSGIGSLPAVFFHSFALMSIAVFGVIIFMICLLFMIISVIVSAVEEKGAADTLKKTVGFLKGNPGAFLFSGILLTAVIGVNAGFFAVRVSFNMFPLFIFGNIVLSVINAVLQNYLVVIAWGSLVVYYVRVTNYPASSGSYEI
jgi:hypothetical protein